VAWNFNDQIVTEQEEEKEVAWNFYNNMLGSVGQRDITLCLEAFHQSNVDLSELGQIFSEEEIWSTTKSLPPDKALGPDRFTGRFYKVAWQVINVDFMAA
jgi:hypothetical protein